MTAAPPPQLWPDGTLDLAPHRLLVSVFAFLVSVVPVLWRPLPGLCFAVSVRALITNLAVFPGLGSAPPDQTGPDQTVFYGGAT
ncbi:MAG: hypothetical protein AAGF79_19775, partial [Pseudomonadota bacterium]